MVAFFSEPHILLKNISFRELVQFIQMHREASPKFFRLDNFKIPKNLPSPFNQILHLKY